MAHSIARLGICWIVHQTLLALVFCRIAVSAELATWLGGTGQWSNSTKWDTANFPNNGNGGTDYDVVFGFDSSDKATLTQDIVINNLHAIGGTIDVGTHELLIKSIPYPPGSIWERNSFTSGVPYFSGTGIVRIPSGGTLDISAAILDGPDLVNDGLTFISEKDLFGGDKRSSSIFNNGEFDIRADAILSSSFDEEKFVNLGVLRKSAGNDTAIISWSFMNMDSGSVRVESGILSLTHGGVSAGLFTTVPDTLLVFDQFSVFGTHDLTGAKFNNRGTIRFTSGTVIFDEPAAIPGVLELSSNLSGEGDVTLENVEWVNRSMSGGGTTHVTNQINIRGGTVENGRTIENHGVATLLASWDLAAKNNATFINRAAATFDLRNRADLIRSTGIARLTNHGALLLDDNVIQWAFDNTGTVELQDGTVDFQGGFTQTAGETIIPISTELRVTSGSLNLNGGVLEISGKIFANIVDMRGGSVLEGSGTAAANLVVNNGGVVSPGLSPGILSVMGNYTQNDGGTLQIEIAGRQKGAQYDSLAVSGTATLDGSLDISISPSFTPAVGDSFDVLSATSIADNGLQLSGDSSGFELAIVGGNILRLTVAFVGLAGDYNTDGMVDAADYVTWRNGLGTTYTQDDYQVWRANFGKTVPANVAVGTIPEPSALLLLASCGLILLSPGWWLRYC